MGGSLAPQEKGEKWRCSLCNWGKSDLKAAQHASMWKSSVFLKQKAWVWCHDGEPSWKVVWKLLALGSLSSCSHISFSLKVRSLYPLIVLITRPLAVRRGTWGKLTENKPRSCEDGSLTKHLPHKCEGHSLTPMTIKTLSMETGCGGTGL